MTRPKDKERFWSKVDKAGPVPEHRPDLGPCWIWTKGKSAKIGGYGQFWLEGQVVYAHRTAYRWLIGRISDGLVIDHLCRVRHCVNPAHMEPVTLVENLRRGNEVIGRPWGSETHCGLGHELTDGNVIRDGARRRCRICRHAQRASARERKAVACSVGSGGTE